MSRDLERRILEYLKEKPGTVDELQEELEVEKQRITGKIDVLSEKDLIKTHKIGRSTACIFNEDADLPTKDSEKPRKTEKKPDETTSKEEDKDRSSKKKGPKTIGIVSGKGGVGKTVVTVNIGAALLELDEKAIVMDADTEMSNLGLHLGMYTYPNSLKEVVNKGIHIMSAIHVDKESGLRVLPTSLSADPLEKEVHEAINMIPEDYTLLIDSPPGYKRPIERVIEVSDELVFVTAPEIPAITDTFKLSEEARKMDKKILGAVVNMYSSHKKHLSVDEVEEALDMPVIGTVEKTDLVQRSIFEGTPVVTYKPHARISRSFKKIASDITGKEYEESFLQRIRGVFSW